MDYDVLVLGGGIIGCAVAYELSKYNLNIAVIEKEYDIADDISFVNTSIVYDGSETSNAIMAGLEYIGNILLEDLCEKFNVPFKRIGALRVVDDDNGVNFRLEEEVLNIKNLTKGFKVVTNKNKFTCKVVINTIADEIYINEKGMIEGKDLEEEDNVFKNMSYLLVEDNKSNKLNGGIYGKR